MYVCTYIAQKISSHDDIPMDTNPAYKMMTSDSSKEPTSCYEDVVQPPTVKMTSNPAYAVP